MVLLASSPPVVTVRGEVGEYGEGMRDSAGEDVRGGTGEEFTEEEAAVSSVVEFDTDCVTVVVFSPSAADGVSSEVGGS